ncbi:MAG: hypothetical protein ABFS45_21365 [Pseudomonadota bacterium]
MRLEITEAIEQDNEFSQEARSAWARLIKQVYAVYLLISPHCGDEMRFLAILRNLRWPCVEWPRTGASGSGSAKQHVELRGHLI